MFLANQSVMTTHSFLSTTFIIVDRLIVNKASLVRHGGLMVTNNLAGLRSITRRYVADLAIKAVIQPLVLELVC